MSDYDTPEVGSGQTAGECRCQPCPGRGNDGHGLTHCAECCFGTGVEAEYGCPVHAPASPVPVQPADAGEQEALAEALMAAVLIPGPVRVDRHGAIVLTHDEARRAAARLLASDWLAARDADRLATVEAERDAHVATDPLCVKFDEARGIACPACAEERDELLQISRGMRDDVESPGLRIPGPDGRWMTDADLESAEAALATALREKAEAEARLANVEPVLNQHVEEFHGTSATCTCGEWETTAEESPDDSGAPHRAHVAAALRAALAKPTTTGDQP